MTNRCPIEKGVFSFDLLFLSENVCLELAAKSAGFLSCWFWKPISSSSERVKRVFAHDGFPEISKAFGRGLWGICIGGALLCGGDAAGFAKAGKW